EAEAGQVDGTFAHAMERIFALGVRGDGLRVADAARVGGDTPGRAGPHRYAERGRAGHVPVLQRAYQFHGQRFRITAACIKHDVRVVRNFVGGVDTSEVA